MDVKVMMRNAPTWQLKDQLGRPLGTITLDELGLLTITPAGSTLVDMALGPYSSLDKVMKAIEARAKGKCWLEG